MSVWEFKQWWYSQIPLWVPFVFYGCIGAIYIAIQVQLYLQKRKAGRPK